MKKISILGAGWVGTPLAIQLKEQGNAVLVSTTQESKIAGLQEKGLQPLVLSLNPEPTGTGWEQFLACDVLVVTIPPRVQLGEENHIEQIKALITLMHAQPKIPDQIIYTSSTTVYPDGDKTFTEDEVTLENNRHRTIFTVEQLLQESFGKQLTIIRYGGLCGPERNIGKFFSGKTDIKGGHHPVNMLHRDDAVDIVDYMISQNIKGEVFNACSPLHPTRIIFYTNSCKVTNMAAPAFDPNDLSVARAISSDKLMKWGYTFKYYDPCDFVY